MLFSYGFMILLFAIIMTPITLRLYHGNRNGKPIYLLVNSLGYFLALAMILLGRGEKSQVGVSLGIVLLVLSLLGLLGSLWFMFWGPLSVENRRFGSILVMVCVAVLIISVLLLSGVRYNSIEWYNETRTSHIQRFLNSPYRGNEEIKFYYAILLFIALFIVLLIKYTPSVKKIVSTIIIIGIGLFFLYQFFFI